MSGTRLWETVWTGEVDSWCVTDVNGSQWTSPSNDRQTEATVDKTGSDEFPEIYSHLFGNLLITYVNRLFPSPASQSDAVK